MDFKIPASNKRRPIGTNTTMTAETKKYKKTSENNNQSIESDYYFNDNFSQYFHTQFIRQISKAEACNNNANKATACSVKNNNEAVEYRFTECSGFSQTLNQSQFEDTITPGQRCNPTQALLLPNTQLLCSQRLMVNNSLRCAQKFHNDDEDDNIELENHIDIEQSSQRFLKEVTTLQLNISSMIDETLLANKSVANESQFIEEQFTIFKSSVTLSEYAQRHRSVHEDHQLVNQPELMRIETNEQNVECDDDEESRLLADFVNNEELNVSNDLDRCLSSSKIELNLIENIEANKENVKKISLATTSNINVVPKQLPPVTTSNFCILGPFFGLPLKVKNLIKDFKGIDDLYDWQKECLQLPAIDLKQNLIYALPTSGGKTLVSEIIIFRELMCRRKNCLFILPYVSIVQEKIWALSPFALHLDFLVEEYAAGKGCLPPRKRRNKKSIYIATIEKAMALFDSLIETDRANEIGLVIVDELHIIGESSRGAVMESLLTKIQYIQAGIQIVGMSATIGNLPELAQFLNADIYHKDFRPVELREFIKCGADLLEIKKDTNEIDEAFVHNRTINFNYSEDALKMDPDQITGLVSEVIPENSCLIFCPTKNNCESLSTMLCQILSKKYIQHKTEEKENLIKAIESDMNSSICPILAKTIRYGIAYHHSGLTGDERRHLEDAFRQNILCVICCTSTLAAGVNLPAKRVIIRSPYVGRDFITLSKYKQMVGRAGRAGFGETGESILICAARDNVQVKELLCLPMDEVSSQMPLNDARILGTMMLSAIGLDLATTRLELQKMATFTLLNVQSNRSGVNLPKLVDDIIANLLKSKALTTKTDGIDISNRTEIECELQKSQNSGFRNEITLSQKKIVLKPSTKLVVSQMGKSSFKSGIDLDRSKIVYKDLVQAQRSLVLIDYFHLLYIVTPFDENSAAPDSRIFYSKFSALTAAQLHTASVIGITEAVTYKLMSGRSLKPDVERIVKRFYTSMMLNELWHMRPISEVAKSFKINRGVVQNLMGLAAVEASCLLKFCEELEEFWAFRDLLKNLSQRLSNICSVELVPLMQLPCVKLTRAKQLYNAGYKTVESVARAKAKDLVLNIEHLNNGVANQLISAAKVLILEKLENLREEVQECLDVYTS